MQIEVILSIVIITGVIVCLIYGLTGPKFKYGRNPYIRECIKCGAIHHMKQFGDDWRHSWWEETSEGNDPKCNCKKHQRNPLPGW